MEILEMESTVTEMKNEINWFMSSLDIDYERISKVEDKSLKIIQTETEKKCNNKNRPKFFKG